MLIKKYTQFILETSKYTSIESDNFTKLYKRILSNYKNATEEKKITLETVLFNFLRQDERESFKINLLDRKKYPTIDDLIFDIEEANKKISEKKLSRAKINVKLEDLRPVWKSDDNNIKVYRLNNIFESIAIGGGPDTKFCTALDYRNGQNEFYNYVYNKNNINQNLKIKDI